MPSVVAASAELRIPALRLSAIFRHLSTSKQRRPKGVSGRGCPGGQQESESPLHNRQVPQISRAILRGVVRGAGFRLRLAPPVSRIAFREHMFKRLVVLLGLLGIVTVALLADFEAGRRAFEKGDYATALKEWMPLADKGDSEAQRRIGGLYERGQGVIRNDSVALNWYRKAALQGNVKALFALGSICPHEMESAQLLLRAEEPLLRQAESPPPGDAEAQVMVAGIWGQKYFLQLHAQGIPFNNVVSDEGRAEQEAQDTAAEGMLRRAAAKGNHDAHIALAGRCVLGLVADCEGLEWLTSAALRGDLSAQRILALAYREGRGVAQSFQEAVSWSRKAAEQGDHSSQWQLGELYSEGKKDVARDYAEAIIWYRKAAEATYSSGVELDAGIKSAEKLAAIFSEDTGALRNDAEAVKWYARAADWGSVKSQRHLGYLYKSASRFRQAAAQGDAASQFELGRMFTSGVGVIQDYTQAYLWLNLAASTESHIWDSSGGFAALGGEAEAAKLRDAVARLMTADQIAEAQALARRWTITIERPLPWTFKLDGPCLAGTGR